MLYKILHDCRSYFDLPHDDKMSISNVSIRNSIENSIIYTRLKYRHWASSFIVHDFSTLPVAINSILKSNLFLILSTEIIVHTVLPKL